MVSYDKATCMIKESLHSLHATGVLDVEIEARADTVLLGPGSPLDSIAFVAFITDLEDRLNEETGDDAALVLQEIHKFNAGAPFLGVGALARYISRETT